MKRGVFDVLEMAEQEYQRTRCIWGIVAGVAKTVVMTMSTEGRLLRLVAAVSCRSKTTFRH